MVITTSSPGSASTTGVISGCQRLCPLVGSAAQRLVRSTSIVCMVGLLLSGVWVMWIAGAGAGGPAIRILL